MLNNNFAQRISELTAIFMQTGQDIVTAGQMAHGVIYRELMVQSNLCAFMSSYKVYMFVMLLSIPLALVLKKQ